MKKRKVPHTFVIVFCIIVIAAVLTWIIPPGKYVSEQVGDETVMTFYYQDLSFSESTTLSYLCMLMKKAKMIP